MIPQRKRIDSNLRRREIAENGFVNACLRGDEIAMIQYTNDIDTTYQDKTFAGSNIKELTDE